MSDAYYVFARRFRPQTFATVLGQDPIIKTMKNGLQSGRLAHAYLFSGARGTGKTSLARLFAKAMNCKNPKDAYEPCNICASCKEITEGRSLDVIEIDGASHRGIDDMRSISESISYAPSSGKYKIYIIDEVHMLTKEAFNALLKTLEEPPEHVKFFFATTEPHKIPGTIISRCQRFNLKRLSQDLITQKLMMIAEQVNISADINAIRRIASFADGGLRDAESMFDQACAFSDGKITEEEVQEVLGLSPLAWFQELDSAIQEVSYKTAFSIVDRIFLEGKDIGYFLHDMAQYYTDQIRETKKAKESFFLSQEECVHILELIAKAHIAMKSSPSSKIILEWLLTSIVQIRYKIPLTTVVAKLTALEEKLLVEKNDQKHNDQTSNDEKRIAPQEIIEKAPQNIAIQSSRSEIQEKARQEGLAQFASVELEGALLKKGLKKTTK